MADAFIPLPDSEECPGMAYSQLYCTVCMTNLVRSTKEGSNISFFCEKCNRELTPEEVEEAKRQRARRGSNESKANG